MKSIALIISTYNRPEALSLVLDSIANQTLMPDEVIVADDGSASDTGDLVYNRAITFPTKLIHSWQEDIGFRQSSSKNRAVSRSSCDYLIFLDGDLVAHPKFVESHMRFAKKGYLLSGGRALLSLSQTKAMIEEKKPLNKSRALLTATNRHNIFHNWALANIFTHTSNTDANMKGGNSSLHMADYVKLNGYNEDFIGWGYEDSEFAARALKSGMTKLKLKFCAITYHLDHEENNQKQSGDRAIHNHKMLEAARKNSAVRCENGLSGHLVATEPKAQTS